MSFSDLLDLFLSPMCFIIVAVVICCSCCSRLKKQQAEADDRDVEKAKEEPGDTKAKG